MRVVVIDRDESVRHVVRAMLAERGCDDVRFSSTVDHSCALAGRCARTHEPGRVDLVVLDLDAGDADAIKRRLTHTDPAVPVVVVHAGRYADTLDVALEVLRARRRQHTTREQKLTARLRRLERCNDELARQGCTDPLTGVANRRHLDELLRSECARAARDRAPLSIAMLDLDDFHGFNARYGHPGGDDCLRRVADATARCLRRPSDILARYGGEEFIALLPATDLTGAWIVAERLRAEIEQLAMPHEASRCSRVVTASAGVATSATPTPRDLVAAADTALFRAKQRGRNRVEADPDLPPIVAAQPPWPACPFVFAEPFLVRLIPSFLDARRRQLVPAREALRAGDLRPVLRLGRELRIGARDLGFAGLVELGARLVHAADRDDRDDLADALAELAWYIDHVQVVYRACSARGERDDPSRPHAPDRDRHARSREVPSPFGND